LYDEFSIEVPLTEWQEKQFIRISVQGYNTQEDIEALVNALEILLPEVRADQIS
jgi:isopenicillin-N epimerase